MRQSLFSQLRQNNGQINGTIITKMAKLSETILPFISAPGDKIDTALE